MSLPPLGMTEFAVLASPKHLGKFLTLNVPLLQYHQHSNHAPVVSGVLIEMLNNEPTVWNPCATSDRHIFGKRGAPRDDGELKGAVGPPVFPDDLNVGDARDDICTRLYLCLSELMNYRKWTICPANRRRQFEGGW
jgi:hypothetical protein